MFLVAAWQSIDSFYGQLVPFSCQRFVFLIEISFHIDQLAKSNFNIVKGQGGGMKGINYFRYCGLLWEHYILLI